MIFNHHHLSTLSLFPPPKLTLDTFLLRLTQQHFAPRVKETLKAFFLCEMTSSLSKRFSAYVLLTGVLHGLTLSLHSPPMNRSIIQQNMIKFAAQTGSGVPSLTSRNCSQSLMPTNSRVSLPTVRCILPLNSLSLFNLITCTGTRLERAKSAF